MGRGAAVDPELLEMLERCGGDHGLKERAERELTRAFQFLVEFVPPEEAVELLEAVWFSAKDEYGD